MAKNQTINKADYNSSKLDKPITDDPKVLDAAKKEILKPAVGTPSSRERASFVKWEKLSEMVGQPFDSELIPFSKLRQMRNDPVLGFGLYYSKTPLIRAPWRIDARDKNGPNPQIAAFIDAALRPVYPSFVNKYLNSYDFGFSAMIKEFKFEDPGAFFVDPKNPSGGEKPAWTDSKIPPIIPKDYIALPPEKAKPFWDEKTGAFGGMKVESSEGQKKQTNDKKPDVGLEHALWATNEQSKVFGSLYGFPRLGYAFKYWWSYWYAWTQMDRAWEKLGVPPILIRYPNGEYLDTETGQVFKNIDLALEAGHKIRSGGVLTLPSDTQNQGLDKISNVNQWDAKYLEVPNMPVNFVEYFRYLDAAKLRSIFVPEQALLEGQTGGSRNVAGEMSRSFNESQYNIKAEIDLFMNKYIIPQIVARNFPDFVANGGTVKIITTAFDSTDEQFTKEIIQLIGQSDATKLNVVDLRQALKNAGIPLKTVDELNLEIEQGLVQTQVDTSANQPADQVNVVPNSGTATGFSYVRPREVIEISLADDNYFNDKTPEVPYFDNKIKDQLKETYSKLRARYRRQYNSLSTYIGSLPAMPADEVVAGKAPTYAENAVTAWQESQEESSADFIKVAAGLIAAYVYFNKGENSTLTKQEVNALADTYLKELKSTIDSTTKDELVTYVTNQLNKGKNFKEISYELGDHFNEHPNWKAMRVIRTEARGIYNDAVVDKAEREGYNSFLVHDGVFGNTDEECETRDGKIIDAKQASEIKGELHPNCTFYLEPIKKVDFATQEADEEFFDEGSVAYFSDQGNALYLKENISEEEKVEAIKRAVSVINNERL